MISLSTRSGNVAANSIEIAAPREWPSSVQRCQPSSSATSSRSPTSCQRLYAESGEREVALAVPGQIERDDLAVRQQRREQLEAAGVVEPTVRSEHGALAGRAPDLGGEREPRQSKAPLDGHGALSGISAEFLLLLLPC